MSVNMKGAGVSGMRSGNFAAPVPSSGSAQPVLDTSTSGPVPSSIHFQADRSSNPDPNDPADILTQSTPDFMPTGATHSDPNATRSSTSDISQQDIGGLGPSTGDESVFKGAPNDGLKGGPAVPGASPTP